MDFTIEVMVIGFGLQIFSIIVYIFITQRDAKVVAKAVATVASTLATNTLINSRELEEIKDVGKRTFIHVNSQSSMMRRQLAAALRLNAKLLPHDEAAELAATQAEKDCVEDDIATIKSDKI